MYLHRRFEGQQDEITKCGEVALTGKTSLEERGQLATASSAAIVGVMYKRPSLRKKKSA